MRSLFLLLLLINHNSKADRVFSHSPNSIAFKENKGQVFDQYHNPRPDVLFSGTNGNMVYHLKNNGISYQLSNVEQIYRVDVKWQNSNLNLIPVKGELIKGEENYYTTSRSTEAFGVKSYKEITYKQIYSGIDLKWYQKNDNLKYDYNVAAGANYKQIHLEFSGVQKISLGKKGELIITTPLGDIIEQAPLVFQNGKTLSSKWVIENNVVSFDIKNIDKTKSFIIDPSVAVRLWGTYYGGSGDEQIYSSCTDASGNVYVTGVTTTSVGTAIATSGSNQTFFGTGTNDAFVAKLDAAGNRLWATYYGDGGDETSYSCATDLLGNVFIAGITGSSGSSLIASAICHQNVYGGGNYDAFLAKFDANGVRVWGTYYGGVADDFGQSCITDAAGNVYLAGYSSSAGGTIIATVGSHQAVKGSANDAFLVKFNAAGVRQWGTFYGGSGPDWGYSCTTDLTGNIFLAGSSATSGGTAIATVGSHQAVKSGSTDGFLVKFTSAGVRQWCTFYGGIAGDVAYSCGTDGFGNVFLNGITTSSVGTAIATATSHQNTFAGGANDAFLAKFDANGIRQWGTYYGGAGNELAYTNVITDAPGNVFIAGTTTSTLGTVMATAGSHQEVYGGGTNDAYIVKFDSAGVRQWGSYYGGVGDDKGFSCSRDVSGNLYLCGNSASTTGTLIATGGIHQSIFGGGLNDAFVVKFSDCTLPPAPNNTSLATNLIICSGNTTTVSASGTGTVSWFSAASGGTVLGVGNNYSANPTVTTVYYAQNLTCASSATRTAISVSVSACIGINEFQNSKTQVNIYPNPNNGEFVIASEFNMDINIVNELGQLIETVSLNETNSHQVSVSNLSTGIYFVVGRNDKEVLRQKVVVH